MPDVSNPFAPGDDNPSAKANAWADPNDLELLKADRFQRWLGAFVDGIIPAIGMVPLFMGFAILGGESLLDDPDALEGAIYIAYFVALIPLTFVNWYLIVTRGQTLGKMAVGTRIVTEEGGPVDFVKGVILRSWVLAIVNAFCGIAALIDVVLIFGDARQCGHDMIAKTIVVNASSWNPYE